MYLFSFKVIRNWISNCRTWRWRMDSTHQKRS